MSLGSSAISSVGETPAQILKRRFSSSAGPLSPSGVDTHSRTTSIQIEPNHNHDLRVIGLGTCGSVFEIPGTGMVYKKGSDQASLWRDFCLTNTVRNATEKMRPVLQNAFPSYTLPKTPKCHLPFTTVSDDAFWSDNFQRFPTAHRTKQPLFQATRIPPLSQEVRESLITLYFDPDETIQREARADPDNKDCLVRIYLGERETLPPSQPSTNPPDSLRNFEFRINMLEALGINVSHLASEMALGLATMHWQAQVNGMDTEFVLGSASASHSDPNQRAEGFADLSVEPQDARTITFMRRQTHLWMLDFDKARTIQMTEKDVDEQLVPAFVGNDPYYPRPNVDEQLWDSFCGVYLRASEIILRAKGVDEGVRVLPQRFLAKVAERIRKNEEYDAGENIIFGD